MSKGRGGGTVTLNEERLRAKTSRHHLCSPSLVASGKGKRVAASRMTRKGFIGVQINQSIDFTGNPYLNSDEQRQGAKKTHFEKVSRVNETGSRFTEFFFFG